jgi:hypothetical protein
MLLKHVQIIQGGRQLKKFDCRIVDITARSVLFHGVIRKHREGSDLAVAFTGNSVCEIDVSRRECVVVPEGPNVQFLITW